MTLEDLLQKVTDQETKVDSIITLVGGLKEQLAEALADVSLTPEQQEKVNAIFAQLEENSGKLDEAIAANTTE